MNSSSTLRVFHRAWHKILGSPGWFGGFRLEHFSEDGVIETWTLWKHHVGYNKERLHSARSRSSANKIGYKLSSQSASTTIVCSLSFMQLRLTPYRSMTARRSLRGFIFDILNYADNYSLCRGRHCVCSAPPAPASPPSPSTPRLRQAYTSSKMAPWRRNLAARRMGVSPIVVGEMGGRGDYDDGKGGG